MGLICVVAIVPSATTTPTEGQSEERLFALSAQLKCQQCVGESVADSQSPSAVQFREEIAEQMAQGRTDDEILNFFAERYDQEILLTPPSSGVGALVWIIPVVAVGGGLVLLAAAYRRRTLEVAGREVTDDDEERVAAALRDRQG
jgi:cytochrome c-type biogenesis protein CcmH